MRFDVIRKDLATISLKSKGEHEVMQQSQGGKRLLRAQSRFHEARLLQLRNQIESLQDELSASVRYIEKLQSRVTAHERRLTTAEEVQCVHGAQIQWAQRAIQGVFAGRLWRSMEFIGRVRRRLFPFARREH